MCDTFGELPAEGTVCETDEHPFPDPEDTMSMFAGKSDEDIALLQAAQGVREVLYGIRGRRL